MATIDVKDAAGTTVAIEKPLAPGRAAAAASRPVALSNEDKAAVDAIAAKLPDLSGGKLPVTDPTALPLPSGAATAANQATANAALVSLVNQTDSVEATLSSIDGKLPALVGGAVPVVMAAPPSGAATAANQATANAALASLVTQTDGLEALLTDLIALLPASLGAKAAAASLAVTLASDGAGVVELQAVRDRLPSALVGGRLGVETLGQPGTARQQAATATTATITLTTTVRRVSLYARTSNLRYVVGTGSVTANASTSHFLAAGERIDIAVPANGLIAVIRDSAAAADGVLEVSELV